MQQPNKFYPPCRQIFSIRLKPPKKTFFLTAASNLSQKNQQQGNVFTTGGKLLV